MIVSKNIRLLLNLFFCRFVKLSSPNINNVLLLGCILTYSTVFMKTTDTSVATKLCKVSVYLCSI